MKLVPAVRAVLPSGTLPARDSGPPPCESVLILPQLTIRGYHELAWLGASLTPRQRKGGLLDHIQLVAIS